MKKAGKLLQEESSYNSLVFLSLPVFWTPGVYVWVGEERLDSLFSIGKHCYPGTTKPETDDKFYHLEKNIWEKRGDGVDLIGSAGTHPLISICLSYLMSLLLSQRHILRIIGFPALFGLNPLDCQRSHP